MFRAGLAAFTKLYADKYAADNIRMNNVLPGFIDSLPEQRGRSASGSRWAATGRWTRSTELIACWPRTSAAYITGQNIRIDGGITRSV